ncbi:EscU/YscU/HrcU family type III secretion system export apparatus switch protein [Limnoglobus roseus]|uniref:Uncharacterized protein n=1 Tax=Limnoglobus roseus TaxID=2598579 RepID=A0A5C1ANW2_9BACT|nr:EscU/YscU/HrcU family type III secretion system export apparatus switch protein [Limnoglobus roseus]QEL21089.1 hypothetical protein PX52LOC_08218 [Limnoglobus roseus]
MAAPDDEPEYEDEDPSYETERPLTGREKARRLFFELIKDCGADVIRMPSSCRVYLGRYLANHPDEADLLVAVLQDGIPGRLMAYEAVGYTDFLKAQTEEFAAKHSPEDARWAVDTWAMALGRPRGFRYVAPDIDPADLYPDPERDKQHDNFVKAAMLFIVGLGGFFGTFMAVALIPIIMWSFEFRLATINGGMVDHMMEQEAANDYAIFLVAFIAAAGFGIVGAAGAVTGWLFAGGEEEPWATSAVASGTAFTCVFFCLFGMFMCCLPPLVFPIIHIVCVFGATYKSAARGGNY